MLAIAMAGMVRPMDAIAEPSARLRLTWTRLRVAARTAAIVSGARTRSAITTPTTAGGKPSAATPDSMAGDSILARPTTATSETTSRPRLVRAARSVGGSACPSWSTSTGSCSKEPASTAARAAAASVAAWEVTSGEWASWVTGRKKSRCRMAWVKTNIP